MKNISDSIPKVDAHEKLSGSAKYVSDYMLEDMHYAKTVRSPHAKAKIKAIHIPTLKPGVHVFGAKDIPAKNHVNMIFDDWPVFAEETVNHVGEPVLLVVAPDRKLLKETVDAIQVEYDPLTPEFSLKAFAVHKAFKKGDAEKAFSEADEIIEETYETGYQEQAYIEPQGFIGTYEDGKTTLIGSIQCPYYVKNALLVTLGCAENEVQVIQAEVGGAFGGKEEFPSLMACQLAIAVRTLKKPIKMIYEREEDMAVTTKRHPSKTRMRAAIKDGRVQAIEAHVSLDAGAYTGLSGVVLSRAMLAVSSAYTIPNLDVSGHAYITNTVPNGAFRGFGAPQMIFAIEMFMHHIGKALGDDPYHFRRKHLVKQGDLTATAGIYRDPILMDKMIDKATAMADYHKKVHAYNAPDVYRGIGMSWFLHGCGFTGSGEAEHIKSKVRLRKDEANRVHILVAAVDMGQGAKTTLRKVVAHVLKLPLDQVIFDNPDTDRVPDSGPTVASRTAMIVGGLLARAAEKLKTSWEDGVAYTVEEQYKQPDYIKWDEDTMQGDAYPAYSWGVNIVEVAVDPVTYQVDVIGIWSVYDVGKALDERIIMGQADGGQAQGVAYGYLEVMAHKQGVLQHKNMTDYIIPTSVDMAPTENVVIDNPYAFGPYGAKGAGELSLVGGAPAVAQAIEQAIGKKICKIPATPEHIEELMRRESH